MEDINAAFHYTAIVREGCRAKRGAGGEGGEIERPFGHTGRCDGARWLYTVRERGAASVRADGCAYRVWKGDMMTGEGARSSSAPHVGERVMKIARLIAAEAGALTSGVWGSCAKQFLMTTLQSHLVRHRGGRGRRLMRSVSGRWSCAGGRLFGA